jgi:LysR family hydrogen peroxide-inducible transcriptional activator
MNFRDLHYLIAVADLKNFGQAAERCFISQPTLSTQIKKLEDSLGVQIFERTNKKVLCTEVGQKIIESARRTLQEVDTIKALAAESKDPLSGNLRLGAFPTLSPYIFPQLVPLIKQAFPRIRLILVEEKTETLLTLLNNGQLDMALLALPVDDEGLACCALFDDEFLLAVSLDHPLAQTQQINQGDLHGEHLLLLDEGHCLRGQALQVCQMNGANEENEFRATSLETLRQMVRAGSGITFIPRLAINHYDEDIHYVHFESPVPSRRIGLVWRQTTARVELARQLTILIQQANLGRSVNKF